MKIGLEVHVQLPTRSKMFCSCPTEGDAEPNTRICPVCMGFPGSKPSLNGEALKLGLKLAKMLECSIPDTTWFSRKIYFYPDLAKNFQITQQETPVGLGGVYMLGDKPIRITRIHLEEDPGKIKRTSDGSSLIDYNRSGIPLAEIVTEPDISSPAEARKFLASLLADIRHTIDLEPDSERSVRCDCNISVGKERCEVKNVTGLKNVERALTFEVVRQTKILRAGGKIERETRHFDEERKVTTSARKKEFEADYGYINEPDLGTYHIARMASEIENKETPMEMAVRFENDYGMTAKAARQIISTDIRLAGFFEDLAAATDTETAKCLVSGVVSSNWKGFEPTKGSLDDIISMVRRFKEGKITDVECNMRVRCIMTGDEDTCRICSEDLDKIVGRALDENPSVIADYAANEKAANRIIGAVMKETGGTYSSAEIVSAVRRLITERL
ncbi:MAG: Asp-tRNA(Asn)/Glu-tRNA(Gln) amidotransferase subunit GatB [Thermoplasmatales archaeon]|jgi:aspartyl-tRNA(Asn)/glutamyl-tRNA(Gln) amidotransferase subunit B|nr:Asp-tRNA(Asn)/Glu-tRNA(Gln) amidotransferase subunit GatB [Thermoplasmatales archaeon]